MEEGLRSPRTRTGRRAFLGAALSAGGYLLLGCGDDDDGAGAGRGLPGPNGAGLCVGGFAGGTFLRKVPFEDEGPATFREPLGTGLDGRLYDDLSAIDPYASGASGASGASVTPTSRFYVRTRYPDGLDATAPWRLRVGGLVQAADAGGGEVTLSLEELAPFVSPRGVHLMECSGNGAFAFFGMLGTASWDGAPLLSVLDAKARRLPSATRVLVSGFDDHSQPSARSTAGASWIFTLDDLEQSGAFLATRMNGEPLAADHGAPLRLVVPGWYGCTCIKWVDAISFVDDTAPATTQMQEFASRTMQNGTPALARDYVPAEIDQAAMPVRVEEWSVRGRLVYRVLGIAWGGKRPTDALSLRMNGDLPFERVGMCAPVTTNATWSWWSYAFEAPRPGRYEMRMRVDDPAIRARRLDSGFYTRVVRLS